MQTTKSTHGLCAECISKGGLNMLESKKPNHCTSCQKESDVLFNQDPYCTACYLQTISSPAKSEMSSQKGHQKTKSFYRPIDKEELKNMKKSFLSSTGKLIKKISKLFEENEGEGQLMSYLNKKAVAIDSLDWEKLIPKVTKASNIVYIFLGQNKIIGAFHSQSVNVEGEAQVWDQEAGIFFGEKQHPDLEFARVKSDMVIYSSKTKTIKFGSPSSLEVMLDKKLRVSSEVGPNFEWVHAFVYKP